MGLGLCLRMLRDLSKLSSIEICMFENQIFRVSSGLLDQIWFCTQRTTESDKFLILSDITETPYITESDLEFYNEIMKSEIRSNNPNPIWYTNAHAYLASYTYYLASFHKSPNIIDLNIFSCIHKIIIFLQMTYLSFFLFVSQD